MSNIKRNVSASARRELSLWVGTFTSAVRRGSATISVMVARTAVTIRTWTIRMTMAASLAT